MQNTKISKYTNNQAKSCARRRLWERFFKWKKQNKKKKTILTKMLNYNYKQLIENFKNKQTKHRKR